MNKFYERSNAQVSAILKSVVVVIIFTVPASKAFFMKYLTFVSPGNNDADKREEFRLKRTIRRVRM